MGQPAQAEQGYQQRLGGVAAHQPALLALRQQLAGAKKQMDDPNELKSLQQRFFTFNSMQTKDKIQQEIAQAYQMLQAAAAEQVRTKDDLANFLELAGRDKAAAVGIK